MYTRPLLIMLAFVIVALSSGAGSFAASTQEHSQAEEMRRLGNKGSPWDGVGAADSQWDSDDDLDSFVDDDGDNNENGEDNRREKCLRAATKAFSIAHDETMFLIDVKAYDRLKEARRHYDDDNEDFDGVALDQLESCDSIRAEVMEALRIADECFKIEGLVVNDKGARFRELAERDTRIKDLLELEIACTFGSKAGRMLQKEKLLDVFKNKSRELELKVRQATHESCVEDLTKAHLTAYNELMSLMNDELRTLLKQARESYKNPEIPRDDEQEQELEIDPQPKLLSGTCQQFHDDVIKKAQLKCLYDDATLDSNPKLKLIELAERDERLQVVIETNIACHSGEHSGQALREIGMLDIFANPKRMALLES